MTMLLIFLVKAVAALALLLIGMWLFLLIVHVATVLIQSDDNEVL